MPPQDAKFTGEIAETTAYVEMLRSLCHNLSILRNRRYELVEEPGARIEAKLRCTQCLSRVSRLVSPSQPQTPTFRTSNTDTNSNIGMNASVINTKPTNPVCYYHTGRVSKRKWTCCGKGDGADTRGCQYAYAHKVPPNDDPTLRDYWSYYSTPAANFVPPTAKTTKKTQGSKKKYQPFTDYLDQYRTAVALDCEMGVSSTKWPELIRVSAVDYFTGETLVDSLVQPDVHMRSLATPWSGVSWADMSQAVQTGKFFAGRKHARDELWKFIGPDTIVVTHAGQNDLNALRWIHPHVVDTQIVAGGRQRAGLRSLCSLATQNRILIQTGEGHCSVEDALATREIAHYHVVQNLNASISEPSGPSSGLGAPLGDLAEDEEETQFEDLVDDEYNGRNIDFEVAR